MALRAVATVAPAGAGPGTVTSITAGTGLTGGTITTAGTVALATPVAVANGGTGASLAATGGAHQVLEQLTVGGAITVAQLAQSDISGVVAIANGGTGATTAPTALAALGGISGNQTITLSGDASGSGATAIAETVTGLQGRPVAATAPATNQVLAWSGTTWAPATPAAAGVTSVTASAPIASSGGATPNLSLTGIVALANGGTGANLAATGGAGQVLQQSTVGGNITVGSPTITIADTTPPASPVNGQPWWNSGDGNLYIYYQDPTGPPQWVSSYSGTSKSLLGVTDGSNAAAGMVGEFISASQSAGLGLSSGAVSNVTSVALTAGDWDVSGVAWITTSGTAVANIAAALSPTAGTFPALPSTGAFAQLVTSGYFGSPWILNVGTARFSITASTTVYLVVVPTFASGGATGYGFVRARRVR